jgi:hypothetical protein
LLFFGGIQSQASLPPLEIGKLAHFLHDYGYAGAKSIIAQTTFGELHKSQASNKTGTKNITPQKLQNDQQKKMQECIGSND